MSDSTKIYASTDYVDSGFVKVDPQELTEEQQKQARENIGLDVITVEEIDAICGSSIMSVHEVKY